MDKTRHKMLMLDYKNMLVFSRQAEFGLWDLLAFCEKGKPKEVLAQVKKCEIDSRLLKETFYVHVASPQPIRPTIHPFQTACSKNNFPIVRLLLEIGADPDSTCCALAAPYCYGYAETDTPRHHYANDTRLQELFDGGSCWWKNKYNEEKKHELQNELEQSILAGEASEAAWLMMKGVRLASPAVLADAEFVKQPSAFKELVCRMGIPDNRLHEFHAWLKGNDTDAKALGIMETLLQAKIEDGRDLAEKLLLSIDLFRADKLDELLERTFSLPVQISMLKHFINAYDNDKHNMFIEETIAALFMDILCKCMEV